MLSGLQAAARSGVKLPYLVVRKRVIASATASGRSSGRKCPPGSTISTVASRSLCLRTSAQRGSRNLSFAPQRISVGVSISSMCFERLVRSRLFRERAARR